MRNLALKEIPQQRQLNVVYFSLCVLASKGFLKRPGTFFDAYVNQFAISLPEGCLEYRLRLY